MQTWSLRAFTVFLLLLPLQPLLLMGVRVQGGLARGVRHYDELGLVVFGLLALILRLQKRTRPTRNETWVLGSVALLGVWCGVSWARNQLPPVNLLLGGAEYVKPFVFAGIGLWLAPGSLWLERTYRWLRTIAVVVVAIALVEQVLAQLGLFPLGGYMDRLGIYRVKGGLGHPNQLAFFVLPFFLIEAARCKEGKPWLPGWLYLGPLMSVSRMAHAGVVLALPLAWRRRWLLLPVLLSVAFSLLMAGDTRIQLGGEAPPGSAPTTVHRPSSYRGYTLQKSVEVWRDHKVFGAGPGRFGGVTSLTLASPVYEKYPWEKKHWRFFIRIRSLDQFWGQALAELGGPGVLLLAVVLLVLAGRAWAMARGCTDPFLEGILRGLSLCCLFIPAYLFGAGLNMTVFLVPTCALLGAALAAAEELPTVAVEAHGPH